MLFYKERGNWIAVYKGEEYLGDTIGEAGRKALAAELNQPSEEDAV